MTTIAQRRVAGATALMILLYLLQVALFAAPAHANVTQVGTAVGTCPQNSGGWSSHFNADANEAGYGNQSVSGDWGSIDFTTDGSDGSEQITATVNAGHVIEICVKQANDYFIFRVNYGDPQPQAVWQGDLSHWSWRVVSTPSTVVFDIGDCEEGLRSVTFTVPADHLVAITWTDEAGNHRVGGDGHAYYEGTHTIDLAPETYQWFLWYIYEITNEGTEKIVEVDKDYFTVDPCETTPLTFGGDLTVEKVVVILSGTPSTTTFDFTVTDEDPFSLAHNGSKSFSYTLESAEDSETVTIAEGAIAESGWTTSISCTDQTVGTNSVEVTVGDGDDITCTVTNTFRDDTTTTTVATTTTTLLQSTSVDFDAFCDDAGNFVGAFSLPNASGSLDLNGDGVFGAGETNLGSGTYMLTGDTYAWTASADAGFTLTGLTSGNGETESCVEVLGTTITTAPAEVSADTLPFTGFESGDTVKLGLLALLAGVLMLFAVRGPKEEEEIAAEIGGWSSL